MSIITRFAPSPTGLLHVGGARTALFNWAFARHSGGNFLLRIEDTDRKRSSVANEHAICAALKWLGLIWDDEIIHQSSRKELYSKCAIQLVEEGKAYRCYATDEELALLRSQQEAKGEKPRYDRRWRERSDHPPHAPYCVRFASPLDGECQIEDLIRGTITSANSELDDLIIMRTDGTATYNFAATVDDRQMGVTHVIRGEDHITNALRQVHIHKALGGDVPRFAHLPLILGGKKDEQGNPVCNEEGKQVYERLSKRNNTVDIDYYRQLGFLPDAMVNYLSQLGWTQPDSEIYDPDELVSKFELTRINRSAARFDLGRLRWVNQQHMRKTPPEQLALQAHLTAPDEAIAIACEKAHTLVELVDELTWLNLPGKYTDLLDEYLNQSDVAVFVELCQKLLRLEQYSADNVKTLVKELCSTHQLKFPRLGMPLRIVLTGKKQTPEVGKVAALLGSEECYSRLQTYLSSIGSE